MPPAYHTLIHCELGPRGPRNRSQPLHLRERPKKAVRRILNHDVATLAQDHTDHEAHTAQNAQLDGSLGLHLGGEAGLVLVQHSQRGLGATRGCEHESCSAPIRERWKALGGFPRGAARTS